jgi:hypothetical protein
LEGEAPSGVPAKNKGIHFSTHFPGCINVPDVVISHSFTIHTWVYISSGSAKSLFGKLDLVSLGFDHLQSYTSSISNHSQNMQMSAEPSQNTWIYLAFSW